VQVESTPAALLNMAGARPDALPGPRGDALAHPAAATVAALLAGAGAMVIALLALGAARRPDERSLVLAALAATPLIEVEAEGLPLSLVRAAEAATRRAAAPAPARAEDAGLSGALFLARTALVEAALPSPVPEEQADRLLAALLAEGLEPEEIRGVIGQLPVASGTAARVGAALVERERPGR
jgi:hypothetical protein